MMKMHRKRRLGAELLLLGTALGSQSALAAGSWCDLLFKDVSATAPNVLIARYHAPKGQQARIELVEILKGACEGRILGVGAQALRAHQPRNGDLFLLALDAHHRLLNSMNQIGACSAISVLPVRGGLLRASDRADYDGGSRPMTLDELRGELAGANGTPRSASPVAASVLAGLPPS